jgi:hypothetical protein
MGFFQRLLGTEPARRDYRTTAAYGTPEYWARFDGHTRLGVVGESFYQPALARVSGAPARGEHRYECEARLLPEPTNPHDPKAVMVLVDGYHVGYLPRGSARRYHKRIADLEARGQPVTCFAFIGRSEDGGGRTRTSGSAFASLATTRCFAEPELSGLGFDLLRGHRGASRGHAPFRGRRAAVAAAGVEPAPPAYEAGVLPVDLAATETCLALISAASLSPRRSVGYLQRVQISITTTAMAGKSYVFTAPMLCRYEVSARRALWRRRPS